jgi:hypothetical protein
VPLRNHRDGIRPQRSGKPPPLHRPCTMPCITVIGADQVTGHARGVAITGGAREAVAELRAAGQFDRRQRRRRRRQEARHRLGRIAFARACRIGHRSPAHRLIAPHDGAPSKALTGGVKKYSGTDGAGQDVATGRLRQVAQIRGRACRTVKNMTTVRTRQVVTREMARFSLPLDHFKPW